MVSTPRGFIRACGLAIVSGMTAAAAEIALVPVDASGSHSIAGDEIVLSGAGQRVFLEIRVSGWDPDLDGAPKLKAWQASLDSSGYASGAVGTLSPASEACADDLTCRTAFGGVCSVTGAACVVAADCPFPAIESCDGSQCAFPTNIGGFCEPGFLLTGRTDYVFALPVQDLSAVDLSTIDFRYASAVVEDPIVDPGVPRYAGTLILDVPSDALGTFTVGFFGIPSSVLIDGDNAFIEPLALTPARITVRRRCRFSSECDDGNACTNDTCVCPGGFCGEVPGFCVNEPNFDPLVSCCAPGDGSLCGLPADPPGDFTGDGLTNLADFAVLQNCLHLPVGTSGCEGVDMTCDCAITLPDVAAFDAALDGTGLAAASHRNDSKPRPHRRLSRRGR